MALLKLLVDNEPEEVLYFEGIAKKLTDDNLVKNPFKSTLRIIHDRDKMFVFLDLETLYPNIIPKAGLMLLVVGLLFGWKTLIIGGGFLSLTFVLWTEAFYFLVLKRSRRKKGVSGRVKLLGSKEALLGVLAKWDK